MEVQFLSPLPHPTFLPSCEGEGSSCSQRSPQGTKKSEWLTDWAQSRGEGLHKVCATLGPVTHVQSRVAR